MAILSEEARRLEEESEEEGGELTYEVVGQAWGGTLSPGIRGDFWTM